MVPGGWYPLTTTTGGCGHEGGSTPSASVGECKLLATMAYERLTRHASIEVELPPVTPYGYALILQGLMNNREAVKSNPVVHDDVVQLVEHLEAEIHEWDRRLATDVLDVLGEMEETPEVTPDGD